MDGSLQILRETFGMDDPSCVISEEGSRMAYTSPILGGIWATEATPLEHRDWEAAEGARKAKTDPSPDKRQG
jgi:hypothetical protein